MSALAHDLRRSDDLIRDLRHMEARAAGDLVDWLVHLDLEGKAARTLYEYARKVAPLRLRTLGFDLEERQLLTTEAA